MDDKPVVERLRRLLEAGDHRGALAWMHRHHERDLQAVLKAEGVPTHERDDLAQTVWLAVQLALPRYRGESSPGTWLTAIARHKILDWRRARNRVLETLTTDHGVGGALADVLGLQAPRTPSSVARGKQRQAELRQAFDDLTAEELELVELRFAEGLIPQQIAQRLAIEGRRRRDGGAYTAADVSQRLHRALEKLRARLRADSSR